MAMIKILDGFYVNPKDIITVETDQRYVTISIRQQANTISFVPRELKEEVKGKSTEDVYRILQTWVDAFVGTINSQQKTTETITGSNAKPKRTIEEVKVDSERLDTLDSLNFALKVVSNSLKDPCSGHWHRTHSDNIETVKGIFINDIKKKIKVLKEALNIE